MRILITGGAGFIGSHLAERLLDQGHQVIVIDNLDTGSLENIRHLLEHPGFELVTESVLNEGLMEYLVRRSDQVYHLAAAVGVRRIIDHPLLSIRTNIRATEIVLEQASRFEKPVLIASTSEVYGKNDGGPLREDDDSIIGSTQITRWLYANTKATDEFLGFAYHRERGLPVVIVRFFNTIGPRQTGQYGMVVPRLVQQALRGEPLTVYGDGQQTRCFTDVRDAVTAMLRLMETPAAAGQTFNIGNSREITIEALAGTVIRMTGSRASIRCIPYEQVYERGFEDMRRRVPDVSKLRAVIGFAPEIPLEEALESIIHHFRAPEPVARPAIQRPRTMIVRRERLYEAPARPPLLGRAIASEMAQPRVLED
jgi:nucleoside-diphosphate-sugar epimerase